MPQRKKIEIFTAGCSTCSETVELVKRIAGTAHDVEILDMHQPNIAARAKRHGIRSLPSVMVDGKLAEGAKIRRWIMTVRMRRPRRRACSATSVDFVGIFEVLVPVAGIAHLARPARRGRAKPSANASRTTFSALPFLTPLRVSRVKKCTGTPGRWGAFGQVKTPVPPGELRGTRTAALDPLAGAQFRWQRGRVMPDCVEKVRVEQMQAPLT
jgi:glutaredoxin 3